MSDNIKLDDDSMAKVSGGTNTTNEFKYNIGDAVTMIGKVGTVTNRYQRHDNNFYSVHWDANEYGPEEDQDDIHEFVLEPYWEV